MKNHLSLALCATSFLTSLVACADPANLAPLATNQNTTSRSATQSIALDKPFLFAYGTWEKKVRIENGVAILRGEGVSPKGGAGVVLASNLNLSRAADNTPTLHVKVGASNKMTTLRLLLIDADGRTASWSFALPPSSTGFVDATPQNGTPLSKPTELDKSGQPLNLSKIMQYQFGGDWSGGVALDIEVSAISFAPPTAEVVKQRAALVQQEAADREKLRLEHEAMRAKYKRNALSPIVSNIAPVATDVLSIEIKSGHVLPSSVTKYVAQSGDARSEKKDDKDQVNEVTVARGGKDLGWLIGPRRDWLVTREGFEGDPLLEFVADEATNLGDAALKKKAVIAISTLADRALKYAGDNAWNMTTPDKGKPMFIGFYSTVDATDLIHAHYLTKNPKYLAGAVQATQFQSGDNPNNIVYTSGLGANPIQHPFKLDSRYTGQNAPVGLTPYGNVDLVKRGDQQWITWPITYFLSKTTTPHPNRWPTNEAYWDLGGWPGLNEFTVDSWAPNIAVWGYLAARP